MKARAPCLGHVFMREIGSLAVPACSQQRVDKGEPGKMVCLRLGKRADDFEPGLDLAIAASGEPFPGLAQQPLHAERALPGGQRIVAYLYDAARPDLGCEQADNTVADRVWSPSSTSRAGWRHRLRVSREPRDPPPERRDRPR